MIDPPMSPEELAHLQAAVKPPCSECHREPNAPNGGHWPWCSKGPTAVRERWFEREQRLDYRAAAREEGCICSDRLGPHVHVPACPLFVGSPTEGPPPSGKLGEGESTEGKDGAASARSASDPVGELTSHLDQEHDSDEGRPWL